MRRAEIIHNLLAKPYPESFVLKQTRVLEQLHQTDPVNESFV